MDRNLIEYFIQKTDERFDKVEKKLDEVLKFKWQIVGGSVVMSFLITLAFHVCMIFFER